MTDTRIPVTVLTGFLGSGKSTVLNRLIKAPDMQGVAVLINEFGDVAVDHHVVEAVDERLVRIDGGCLCCSVQGDLVRGLRDLFMRGLRREIRSLRRVVIETTGLAEVAPVLHTLQTEFFLRERYRPDGVVATVDSCHASSQLTEWSEATNQVAMADVLLVTKLDLAGPDALSRIHGLVTAINPAAEVIPCTRGHVQPARLLGRGAYTAGAEPRELSRWLQAAEQGTDDHHHHHHHDPRIRTFNLQLPVPIRWAAVSAALERLQEHHGERLLRVKGVLSISGEERPVLLHAVHHQRYPAVRLETPPQPGELGRLVFIVRELDRDTVQELLGDALRPAETPAATIGPDD